MAKSFYGSFKRDRALKHKKFQKEKKRTGPSDPNWLEARSCTSKKWYKGQREAISACRVRYRQISECPDLSVYDCSHCDGCT